MKRLYILLFLLFIVSQTMFSDNIRGPFKNIVSFSHKTAGAVEIEIEPEELFALVPSSEADIPEKIQLEIRPSARLNQYPGTFALFYYNSVEPEPDKEISSYTGNLVKYFVLPEKNRYYIDIYPQASFQKKEVIPGTDYLSVNSNKILLPSLLTILPVMKGIPDGLLSEKLKIRISFVYPDRGSLSLRIYEKDSAGSNGSFTESSGHVLYINNIVYSDAENIVLDTGIKKIRIEKEGFVPFEQSIIINKNEKNSATIYLTRLSPVLTIFAPSEAEIYLNGEAVESGKEIKNIPAGEHTIIYKLGQYSLSRKFMVENGKRYSINLLLDIDITEN